MDMTKALTDARPAENRTRRLLIRMNTTLFHCIGAVVLLESAAAATRAAEGDEPVQIRGDVARIDALRDYVKGLWPEFDWDAACGSALARCASVRCGWAGSAATCMVEAYVPALYAALLHVVEDPALRRVMAPVAAMRTRCNQAMARPASPAAAAWCTITSAAPHAQSASARALRGIFDMLQHHWLDTPPFPVLGYGTALARAWTLLAGRLELTWSDSLLLRMWLRSAMQEGATPARAGAPVGSTDVHATGNVARRAAYALPPVVVLR